MSIYLKNDQNKREANVFIVCVLLTNGPVLCNWGKDYSKPGPGELILHTEALHHNTHTSTYDYV